ncbi:MAG: hypothetical protein O3A21_01420, partial [Proteobacteria bacterium]|nr:hypothetical protein [Pseudomonadota bacterium]
MMVLKMISMFSSISRSTAVVVTMLAMVGLVSCETAAPKPELPKLSYAGLGLIRLDVAKIEIIDEYLPTLKRP